MSFVNELGVHAEMLEMQEMENIAFFRILITRKIEKSTFVLSLPFSLFAFQPEDREKLYTRGCSDMVSSKNGKVDGINGRDSSTFRTELQNRRSREKSRLAVILHSESIEERIRRKSWIGNKRCV